MNGQPKQTGAVLVVSLIILTVLALIGVGSLQNSTLEERMAANLMNRQITFQAAESAAEAAANSPTELNSAINSGGTAVSGPSMSLDTAHLSATSTIDYLGPGTMTGWRLGENSDSFKSYLFSIQGTGTLSGPGSSTTVEQGYNIIGPGS